MASNATKAIDIARTYIGTKELPGKSHNPIVVAFLNEFASWVNDDETPWCGAFVNYILKHSGHQYINSWKALRARSFLKYGDAVKKKQVQRGDIVVLTRGGRHSKTGHVGFVDEIKNGLVYVLGGNQRNEVNITAYPEEKILGFRRPIKRSQPW